MRRAKELVPLSHDHHIALELALRLRRARPENRSELRGALLEFWESAGEEHVRQEEKLVFPHLLIRPRTREMVFQALADHQAIRVAVDAARRRPLAVSELHSLGETLRDHVRLEERRIFPAVERLLDDEGLSALGNALTVARAV